ncbi:glycosyl transferase family 1 [Enterovibrio norvegicus]|uniref:glycosyltransferase n=1 Tax=Enterovibrio norvegicus TaxID=188144 RepID=UPI00037DF110|nr:glycosyltransferase [Enterovibrio norvegicus]OEF59635.1 glycosyl transferase family 1 [Enterovibrio norvegicus]
MRVLHVYRTCYPETKGGLEQAIRYICKGSTEQGYKNTILTLGESDKEYYFEGTRIVVVKKQFEISSNGFSFSLIRKFRSLTKEHDIIHYQYPWPSGDFLSLFASKKPTLVSYQSDIVKQKLLKLLYRPLELKFLSSVDRIVASSPQYAASSENLQAFTNKVDVIPLGVDETTYPDASDEKMSFWKSQVGEGFFLFVGVLRYYKGLQYLLEAAKINKLPVVIAGAGPEKASLEKYITENNLTNVRMVGFIDEDDKVALHRLSKAFVFPSHLRSEAFGISLVEAQIFSKPIVSCDIGTGSSYVNIHMNTGLQVPGADSKAFAGAMSELAENSELAITLGNNARKRFEDNFTSKRYAENYLSLYQSLS